MKNYEVTSAGGYISRGGTTGLLGSNDTMDVPFTQLNLTQKVIEDYGEPTLALDNILINSPNVRGGTTLHNDFRYAVLRFNGSSMYIHGIPGLMTQFNRISRNALIA